MKQTVRNIYNAAVIPYHKLMGFIAATNYDYPASAMTVIGVTGTNGKTSTCHMIYSVLKEAGLKAGIITTVGNAITDGELKSDGGHMTTADTYEVNKQIAEMRAAGVQYLVLEVSSHGLAQSRIFGVPIDIAVMTNVTPEHLDYHRTFERYRKAKMKLFQMAADNFRHGGRGVGIVNEDDASSNFFAKLVPNPVTYGVVNGDLKATRIKSTDSGVEYYTRLNKDSYHIKVNIPGEFYVYNSLAAVAVCHELGIDKKTIEKGIADLAGVAGRMNKVENDLGINIIVDYAHTPDSYEKILPEVRKDTTGKVYIVCGAAGQRDDSKFPTMGRLAAKYGDLVILTEEDPKGPVRPQSELLAKGIVDDGGKEGEDFIYIDDRMEAIAEAVNRAEKGDAILVLGMGHQKKIDRANGTEDWIGDADAVKKAIDEKKKQQSKKVAKADNEDSSSKSAKTGKVKKTAKAAKSIKTAKSAKKTTAKK